MRMQFLNANGEIIKFKSGFGKILEYALPGSDAEATFKYYQGINPDIASWQIDAEYEAVQTKKSAYAEINTQYSAEISNIREAIRLVLDRGGDATTLRAKLAAKQAEYKAALLAV